MFMPVVALSETVVAYLSTATATEVFPPIEVIGASLKARAKVGYFLKIRLGYEVCRDVK